MEANKMVAAWLLLCDTIPNHRTPRGGWCFTLELIWDF
jgi:hypothetical protein